MQHQILLVWCLTALSLIFSAVTGSYSSYFRAGYLKDSSFIIKQEPPAWTETQIVCASRCLIYIKRILNRCNAYQYDLDTKMCTLLVVPSVMIDTDSGDGIKVMLSDQVVSVPSEKLKRNMRAFWTFTADKTIGRLDLTVYGSTISDSGSMDEFFKDNEYALQLQNTYGTINPKKGALTVKGESLTVCLWFKDYDLKTDDIFLTWKYNYRRALGQCERSRLQCDNPSWGCTGLCTTDCGNKACVFGVCTPCWRQYFLNL
ncbi:uncharacterized protein LOC111694783 [Eurytemora carolleeae]|uniref:uncharacterized protein LOC111694783 n=1 Tax=Eurytemora carolleeae TaxID=1294199 RepID=UPI000C775AD6|nr:uncharacterized protein LOC111694783 [Eurytemora carolleeae]|eukprot:XP_023319580.1 uncharacterized protein LOC111694783 [Eurytemora affinis]